MFPTRNLLLKTLEYLRGYQGGGLLIAPDLPNVPWYTNLPYGAKKSPILSIPSQICQGRSILVLSVISATWAGYSFKVILYERV